MSSASVYAVKVGMPAASKKISIKLLSDKATYLRHGHVARVCGMWVTSVCAEMPRS